MYNIALRTKTTRKRQSESEILELDHSRKGSSVEIFFNSDLGEHMSALKIKRLNKSLLLLHVFIFSWQAFQQLKALSRFSFFPVCSRQCQLLSKSYQLLPWLSFCQRQFCRSRSLLQFSRYLGFLRPGKLQVAEYFRPCLIELLRI